MGSSLFSMRILSSQSVLEDGTVHGSGISRRVGNRSKNTVPETETTMEVITVSASIGGRAFKNKNNNSCSNSNRQESDEMQTGNCLR